MVERKGDVPNVPFGLLAPEMPQKKAARFARNLKVNARNDTPGKGGKR